MAATCAYCGDTEDESTATHSGVMECRTCWYWRKLDGPAASHWEKVSAEFLSNVDLWDVGNFFPRTLGVDIATLHSVKEVWLMSKAWLSCSPAQRKMSYRRAKVDHSKD